MQFTAVFSKLEWLEIFLSEIFVETMIWWIESSKEKHLFEVEIFCYIINAFTVTFDQFNLSSLNKNAILF